MSHKVSFGAAFATVLNSISPIDYKAGICIPSCPLKTCTYCLDELEIIAILDRGYEENRQADYVAQLHGKSKEELKEVVTSIVFRDANMKFGHMRCPSCKTIDNGDFWFVPPERRGPDDKKLTCPNSSCRLEFCRDCSAIPFHYHATCTEVMQYTRAWNDWLGRGRDKYVEEMNVDDEDFAQKQNEYEKAKLDNAKELEISKRNYEILVQDEKLKEDRCRRCPHCNNIVERVDGCSSMICGRDHADKGGANHQNGCGKGFNWDQAQPYKACAGDAPTLQEINMLPPDKAKRVQHYLSSGQKRTCDICKYEIVGPMIKCMNCPSFYYCLKCNSKNKNCTSTKVQLKCNPKKAPGHIGIVFFENENSNS